MAPPETDREQQALDWVRRIADPDFDAWDAHIRWLEEDPRNAGAFDRISLQIEAATEGLAPAGPLPPGRPVANDNERLANRRRWRVGGSVAGALAAGVAALLIWPHQPEAPSGRMFATAPGVSREIALADGTRIALNGGSRLRVDGDRTAELIDGEGYFEVTHHADRPFRLQVGGRVVQDVGTSFDVATAARSTRIMVREGAVAIDPEGDDVRLAPGQQARIGADGNILRTTVAQQDMIGGWRAGRLVYQGATWTEVVTDLSRTLGVPVTLDPGMSARRFTGVVMLDRDKARTIRRLAGAANVSAVQEGQGWRLAPR